MSGTTMRLEKFKANKEAKRQILTSQAAEIPCMARARVVRAKASRMYGSANYIVHGKKGKERFHAFVATGDRRAMLSNKKHNTLLKALGGKL